MIKADELRMGNIAERLGINIIKGKWEQVFIGHRDIADCEMGTTDFRGIPLTEEWLIRFGFEETPDKSVFIIDAYFYDTETEQLYHDDESLVCNESVEIEYVHQLQNIFFALTGEELIIKL